MTFVKKIVGFVSQNQMNSESSFIDDDGFTYVAVKSFGSCDDCAFADQTCVLNTHSCIAELREDKQDIYWQPITGKNNEPI
jgi:hypothetical protein